MPTYLKKIELTKYRSCKKTSIQFHPRLSALIGANASGKSNLLNGILLLRKIARITRPQPEDESSLSGCKLTASFSVRGKVVKYQAVVKYMVNERNIDQVVGATQKWNFQEITGQKQWIHLPWNIPFDMFTPTRNPERLTNRQRKLWMKRYQLFSGLESPDVEHFELTWPLVQRINEFIAGTTYYSASRFTDPSRCPTSFEFEGDANLRRLHRAGGEHVQFMHDLYSAFKGKNSEFEEYLSIVGQDGIGLIDTIQYDEIDVPSRVYQVITGGRVITKEVKKLLVIPNFVFRGTKLSPNQLSEGTFKTLAIIFYLVTDKSRLLLLEEPEVCVHHGLLASIMEIIRAFSRRKQIIISTHSDFVIDALDPTNVFIVRNDEVKGTIVKHVPSSMSSRQYKVLKEYLRETGNLGEYWRHGELER